MSVASDIDAATAELRAQDRTGTGASFIDLGVRIEKNVLLDMKSDLASAPAPQYEQATWYGRDGKARLFQRVGHDTTPESRFVVEEYRYDALGRRVMLRSQTRATCTAAFCKPALERFIWDGDQLLYEIRIKGDSGRTNAQLDVDTVTADSSYGRIGYVHGLGIDAPIGLDRNGVLIIPHENWRGFYDSGADSTGNAFVAAINWIGREQDPFMDSKLPRDSVAWSGSLLRAQQDQSGLMFRRNRYYDPATGRFTQVDPIGLRGGANLYGYANGDPVNLSDPLGLWPSARCISSVAGALFSVSTDLVGLAGLKAAGRLIRSAMQFHADAVETGLRRMNSGFRGGHAVPVPTVAVRRAGDAAEEAAATSVTTAAEMAGYRASASMFTSEDFLDVILDMIPGIGSAIAIGEALEECFA